MENSLNDIIEKLAFERYMQDVTNCGYITFINDNATMFDLVFFIEKREFQANDIKGLLLSFIKTKLWEKSKSKYLEEIVVTLSTQAVRNNNINIR